MVRFRRRPSVVVTVAVAAGIVAACTGTASSSAVVTTTVPTSLTTRPASEVIRVDIGRRLGRLPAQFVGLSLESFDIKTPLLDPTRTTIASFLSDLGPSRLRIGGTESGIFWQTDPSTPIPTWAKLVVTDADFLRLAALTTATGWRLDLGVGLSHYDPGNAAMEVADASRRLGASLASVEIGNEPDLFASKHARPSNYGYGAYKTEITAYQQAIAAAAPAVPIAGPDTARSPAVTDWLNHYAADEHKHIAFLTQHSYATTACNGNRTSIGELLSPKIHSREDALIDALVTSATRFDLPARIDETNSTSCGGQAGVSDRFASALWAVDDLLDAARRGVAGVNVHGFVDACVGYTPLCADHAGRLRAEPVFYAMLFVHAVGIGQYVAADVPDDPSLSAYAVRRDDGSLAIVAINRDAVHAKTITISAGQAGTAQLMRLIAPTLDAADNITFGESQVGSDGTFTPSSTPVRRKGAGYQIVLPHGSAALLTIPK